MASVYDLRDSAILLKIAISDACCLETKSVMHLFKDFSNMFLINIKNFSSEEVKNA